MELSVKDRLYLPTFLPVRGNFKEFNLKKEILRKIAIGDEERKVINLRENAEDKRMGCGKRTAVAGGVFLR